jgi:hypothetical protein
VGLTNLHYKSPEPSRTAIVLALPDIDAEHAVGVPLFKYIGVVVFPTVVVPNFPEIRSLEHDIF